MSDRRLTPSNGRVAALSLRGRVEAETYTAGILRQVSVPVLDVLASPGGSRDRQLLFGQDVTVYETLDGVCFIQSRADGYVGYVPANSLGDAITATHVVSARSTHAYTQADFKSPEASSLSLGSRLAVSGTTGRFAETNAGFVPAAHIAPLDRQETDPVAVAERFLGTPYLWGGNSGFGIDCSGLVQVACHACGITCPGDSDMQQASLGSDLGNRAPRRGDLLFWKGHVAWVADPNTLLHANVHHMAVAYEPMDGAIARIRDQGDGPVTSMKRLGGTT